MKELIIGLLLGAIIMYFAYPKIVTASTVDPAINYAKAKEEGGLMLFVESEPINRQKFKSLKTLSDAAIQESISGMLQKDLSLGERILRSFNAMSYREKLNNTIKIVRRDYPSASAIILREGFKECEVLETL